MRAFIAAVMSLLVAVSVAVAVPSPVEAQTTVWLPAGYDIEEFVTGLGRPFELEFNAAGDAFIADNSPDGPIWRVSGGTVTSFASLECPESMEIDAAGQLYVGQSGSGFGPILTCQPGTVVLIDPAGSVNSFASVLGPDGLLIGLNGHIYATGSDGVPGIFEFDTDGTQLNFINVSRFCGNPGDLAQNSQGDLFVGCDFAGAAFKVSASGQMSSLGVFGGQVAVDASDNIYVGVSSLAGGSGVIYKIDPSGSRTFFAAGLGQLVHLKFGPDGALYVSKIDDGTVMRIFQCDDTTPPQLEVTGPFPSTLGPPDRTMRQVRVNIFFSDPGPCRDPSPKAKLIDITVSGPDIRNPSSGPLSGPDIQGAQIGTLDRVFSLRAELDAGFDPERIYTITYEAVDAAGNTTQVSTTVSVPASGP